MENTKQAEQRSREHRARLAEADEALAHYDAEADWLNKHRAAEQAAERSRTNADAADRAASYPLNYRGALTAEG